MNLGPSNAFGVSAGELKAARRAGYSPDFLRWALRQAMPLARLHNPKAVEAIESDAERLEDAAGLGAKSTTAPIDPDAHESELRELAKRRAALMLERVENMAGPVTHEWLDEELHALEARPFGLDALEWGCKFASAAAFTLAPAVWLAMVRRITDALEEELRGRVKRATCRYWWTRNVRRAATRKREAREQAAGRVSVRTAPYVGDETAVRWEKQRQRNVATLERTEIESADGEIVTLLAAMQASTANPEIRRGELMTRIKGAEEWAAARGMVGMFTTNTLPSRFHAAHFKGGKNANYDGSTPRDGQAWLCKTWARSRSALARYREPRRYGCRGCGRRGGQSLFGADLYERGLPFFGFRVAEPHHDGCPHWHMLLFVDRRHAEALRGLLRAYWLQDSGDEPGAEQHRFKAVEIDPKKGDAAGYVAKYIAKNIDDTGLAAHLDEADGVTLEIGTASGNKARRVLAWASAWGIRQFQAVGQPPVTVWRELRRVDSDAVLGASYPMRQAHQAVNREGERKACWRGYMEAQGGAMRGRAHRIKLETETEAREGLYGVAEQKRIVGVVDVTRPGEVVRTGRKAWKPRGTWTDDARDLATRGAAGAVRDWLFARPQAAQPRTRVNNCTRRGGAAFLMGAGIVGAANQNGAGGLLEQPPWATTPPPRPSNNSPKACSGQPLRQSAAPSCPPASSPGWRLPRLLPWASLLPSQPSETTRPS